MTQKFPPTDDSESQPSSDMRSEDPTPSTPPVPMDHSAPEDPYYLPDDWFDEEPIEHHHHRGAKIVVAVIALLLAIAMTLYYTIPILIPVKPNPLPKSSIPQNEETFFV